VKNIIPLNQAVICVTCDSISDEKGLRCPACGSLGLMNLANVLGTMNDEHPDRVGVTPEHFYALNGRKAS
jgi:RNA polymerase subunit RPABC4/transcription elongation factor Spt4